MKGGRGCNCVCAQADRVSVVMCAHVAAHAGGRVRPPPPCGSAHLAAQRTQHHLVAQPLDRPQRHARDHVLGGGGQQTSSSTQQQRCSADAGACCSHVRARILVAAPLLLCVHTAHASIGPTRSSTACSHLATDKAVCNILQAGRSSRAHEAAGGRKAPRAHAWVARTVVQRQQRSDASAWGADSSSDSSCGGGWMQQARMHA